MSFGETIAPFLGRVMLAWFFLSEAYWRLLDWGATVQLMSFQDIPAPDIVLFVSLLLMVLGSLALLLGFRTRVGALVLFLVLFLVLLVSTVGMHDFWNIQNAGARQADYDLFARDMAICGALLFIIGIGPGKFAVESGGGGGGGKGRR